ncbi:hypothetical protein C2W59_02355 [Bacillus pumilus]|nr:hypothetical protein US8_02742 [Bacillus altitudinis]RAP17552.1 hypothetical protein C2W59_02355 [Bacillus pumilus]RAP20680.1 hypothetical protein C2W64_03849 [Brevibacillus laterosporus]
MGVSIKPNSFESIFPFFVLKKYDVIARKSSYFACFGLFLVIILEII